MKYYLKGWKNFANFNGRARRKEFWWFVSPHWLVLLALNKEMDKAIRFSRFDDIQQISTTMIIIVLITLIPTLAVGVRRMHDVGKSGWFYLIPIYRFILAITNGEQGTNEYGENPKEEKSKTELSQSNKSISRKDELVSLVNKYKGNLDSYIEQLKFEIITNEHTTNITSLIHSYLSADWLLNNEIRGTFEEASNMLDVTKFEQVRVVSNLKNYLDNRLLNNNFTLDELNNIKKEGLKLASKEMNEIFRKL